MKDVQELLTYVRKVELDELNKRNNDVVKIENLPDIIKIMSDKNDDD